MKKLLLKLIGILTISSVILITTQNCETENQHKRLTFNTDTVNHYSSILNELMDNSKYLMDYDAGIIAWYTNDSLTNGLFSEDSLVCNKNSRCKLGLSPTNYDKVFKPILNNPDIIDVYMKVAKNGGFILRPKTDGNFRHWRSKIKEIEDSLDNSITEIFYVAKLEIDTSYGNDEVFLENDSINIHALNGTDRIKYQHVMILKKRWKREDGYIDIEMFVKLRGGQFDKKEEEIRFVQ